MTTPIPVNMSASGPVATSPLTIQAALIAGVVATNPGYTANLPASMIEDMSSTEVAGIAQMDQYRVDAINSVTPYGANASILQQQGQMLGIPQGVGSNTSVYVTFTGSVNYTIPAGFVVSDGTHSYVLQTSVIIPSSGTTTQVYCVAQSSGSWAVPANTVTTVVTSVPSPYVVTVTNPTSGTPSVSSESVQDYRSRIMQAQTASAQGVPNYLQTLLQEIPGVTSRLVTVLQAAGGWEVICGGGDQYSVAGAIYLGTLDLSSIVGSTTSARNINVTITDVPNNYEIVYVNPPQQVVTITATWNTTLANFTTSAQVNQLGTTAIQNYINSIIVGQPINELDMSYAFQEGVNSVIAPQWITTLIFDISINGTPTSPNAGTSIIPGDPESYFYALSTGITVVQG